MRVMTMAEIDSIAGGDFIGSFNDCMADNWWSDTSKGAIGGAIGGAFLGPGAFVGGIVGAMSGSTAAFGYCVFQAI